MMGIYKFYDRVDSEVKTYLDYATEWAANVNRQALGSFVTSHDEFVAAIALGRWNVFVEQNPAEDTETENYYSVVLDMLNKHFTSVTHNNKAHVAPLDELIFWQRVFAGTVSNTQTYFGSKTEWMSDIAKMKRMETMYLYPSFTRYFEAGIWDIPLIEKSFAAGIDAALVTELVPS